MLAAITALLLCQLIGEAAVRLAALPVPGPVLGLVLLLAILALRRGVPGTLESTAGGLLKHFSLLFVPAGVGVLQHLPRIEAEWLAIAAALLVSSVATIVVTAAVMRGMIRLMKLDDAQQGGGG
ncbi:MAG TPA: CidA/LrgA family protein [Kiloniellaceae bacterium]|nr:CidA/LrgA family protein [Kiloniellaceae bacterium]